MARTKESYRQFAIVATRPDGSQTVLGEAATIDLAFTLCDRFIRALEGYTRIEVECIDDARSEVSDDH